MSDLLGLLILGLASASIYAVAASGLVVTYTTSGIFNFAHGAVAMFSAFIYWQLSSPDAWGLPVPLALVLTLGVFAPGLGLLIDRLLMRRLHDATPIIRIVVPIALLVLLIQVATVFWPPAEVNASLPRFFAGKSVSLAGVAVEYHQLVVFLAAIIVAIGLRVLLYSSQIGVSMRAVVDSPELAALNGVSPDRISGISWALGCSLAALAGILIAPIISLDQTQLTLLVINAYAAAMVGRLRSLPLTALGAVILGISREAANRYQSDLPSWITVETVPALMLFVVLVVVPQDKAAMFGQRRDRSRIPNPTMLAAVLAAVGVVAVAAVLPSLVHGSALDTIGYGLALGIVALSLVPLTGYAGQLSLAPLAFAGIGAVVMYEWGSDGNPLALLAVVGVCAAVGALVAIPTLRLKGLYLALSTMAFAIFCEKAVFSQIPLFKDGLASFDRLRIGSFNSDSPRANLIVMAVMFAVLGLLVSILRRGKFGRRLQAMKDSPAACATIGLSTTSLKLEVFALSAAIAGLGGAMLAGWRGKAGPEQFALLQGALPALPLVLMAVVGGIASVAGVLVGASLLAIMPMVGDAIPAIRGLMTVLPGLAGLSLAANPDGAVAQTVSQLRAVRRRLSEGRLASESIATRALAMLLPGRAVVLPEAIAVGGPVAAPSVAYIDAQLGLDWGRCDGDPGSP